MEKAATALRSGGGVLRLPPGFRFHPTDEELVVQYLRRKVYSCPLAATIIPEVEVCKSDPWDLPGDSEQDRYFFSTREAKYPNGNRANRATVSGYWKATGIDRQIVVATSTNSKENRNQVLGMKKTLVFYQGKPPSGIKSNWIMHEYRLVADADAPCSAPEKMNLNKSPVVPMENWVLCRIFSKKPKSRKDDDANFPVPSRNNRGSEKAREAGLGSGRPVCYDFMARVDGSDRDNRDGKRLRRSCLADLNLFPESSSSESSGVTEVSSSGNNDINKNNNKKKNNGDDDSHGNGDDHEESSCNNSLLFFLEQSHDRT